MVEQNFGSIVDERVPRSEGFVLIIDESSMISNGYEIFEESEDNEGLLLDKLMYVFYKFIPNKNKFIFFVGVMIFTEFGSSK